MIAHRRRVEEVLLQSRVRGLRLGGIGERIFGRGGGGPVELRGRGGVENGADAGAGEIVAAGLRESRRGRNGAQKSGGEQGQDLHELSVAGEPRRREGPKAYRARSFGPPRSRSEAPGSPGPAGAC